MDLLFFICSKNNNDKVSPCLRWVPKTSYSFWNGSSSFEKILDRMHAREKINVLKFRDSKTKEISKDFFFELNEGILEISGKKLSRRLISP